MEPGQNDIENHQLWTIGSLIDSIDNGDHNDLEIILEDGAIKASKLILCSVSEYFKKMFDKNNPFKEQEKNQVKFACKKQTMKKILVHLYGGELSLSSLIEHMEVMDILRFLLLEKSFALVEESFEKAATAQNGLTIKQCLDAVEIANSLKLDKASDRLSRYLMINVHTLVQVHVEDIATLSEETFFRMMNIERTLIKEIDQMTKLKFVELWLVNHGLSERRKQRISEYFDLKKFTVNQLLGEVWKSKLFSHEEIFETVKILHKKIEDENKKLHQSINENKRDNSFFYPASFPYRSGFN